MKKTNYKKPQIEVYELELNIAILVSQNNPGTIVVEYENEYNDFIEW